MHESCDEFYYTEMIVTSEVTVEVLYSTGVLGDRLHSSWVTYSGIRRYIFLQVSMACHFISLSQTLRFDRANTQEELFGFPSAYSPSFLAIITTRETLTSQETIAKLIERGKLPFPLPVLVYSTMTEVGQDFL
jgi:hypothetical protein